MDPAMKFGISPATGFPAQRRIWAGAACLLTVGLLASGGEVGFGARAADSRLPPCPVYLSPAWNNCYGIVTMSWGESYAGEWKGGQRHGQGKALLANSGINVITADDLDDAAIKAVAQLK
jgi:hypothetical protein